MNPLTRRQLCSLTAGATAASLSGCLGLADILDQSARFCGVYVYNFDSMAHEVSFRLLDGDEIIHEKTALLEPNDGDVITGVLDDDLPYNEGTFTASLKVDSDDWEDRSVNHPRHDELLVDAYVRDGSISSIDTLAWECDRIDEE